MLFFTETCLQLKKTFLDELKNDIFKTRCQTALLKSESVYLNRRQRLTKIKKKYFRLLKYETKIINHENKVG